MFKGKKAIIFDLDGTLLNTARTDEEYFYFCNLYGDSYLYFEKGVDYINKADIFLKMSKEMGLKVALATMSNRHLINLYNRCNKNINSKISLFEAFGDKIFTRDDVFDGKPMPDIYLAAAKGLNLKPSECIAIEDSLEGVCAATNAGIDVIAIYNKASEEDMPFIKELATYTANSYDELIKELQKLDASSEMYVN